jgi:adenylate cyclase
MHTGDAVVGNMGSQQVFAFTAVGDSVNLASRLEGANKHIGSKIIISETTYQSAGEEFLVRELGMIEVKGKTVPVRIFELLAKKATASAHVRELASAYGEAYELMRSGDMDKASAAFGLLLEKYPDDGPARFHKERCDGFLSEPALTDQPLHIKMMDK